MSEYYLVHSRTKGSKNGIRRYQFTDGTWTEEGKARRRAEYGEMYDRAFKPGKDGKPSKAVKIMNKSSEIIDVTDRMVTRASKKKSGKDPKEMSDKELREALNRLRMEQEYDRLSQQEVSEGSAKAHEILEYVGDAVTITGGLFAIWESIHSIRKG